MIYLRPYCRSAGYHFAPDIALAADPAIFEASLLLADTIFILKMLANQSLMYYFY